MATATTAAGPVLDHVGVVTDDLDAVRRLAGVLGLEIERTETDDALGATVLWLRAGPVRIEVLAASREDGLVASALASGRLGVDHVALRVPDCAAALVAAREAGATLLDRRPRRGVGGTTIGFLDPADGGGLRIELVQPAATDGEVRDSPEPGASSSAPDRPELRVAEDER